MADTNLNRETLAEQVAQAMLQRIQDDQLKPGDALPSISTLADEFSVSRPVIREALKTLEGREIIQVSNGRSAVVKPVSSTSLKNFFQRAIALNEQTLIELMELRQGLEIQSASLAATRHTPKEARRLQNIVKTMGSLLEDIDRYTEFDLELHITIAHATRNSLMYFMIESIRDALQDAMQEGMRRRRDMKQLLHMQHLHERIVDAVTKGDADEAALAMAAHFDDAITLLSQTSIPLEDV